MSLNPAYGNKNGGGNGGGGEGVPFVGAIRTAFSLRLINNAGVLSHRMGAHGFSSNPGNFLSTINNATNAFTPTPTGPDASTAMAGGMKRSDIGDHVLYLDTLDQDLSDFILQAQVSQQNAGTPLNIRTGPSNRNINGVTRNYLQVQIADADTGTGFGFNTTNFGVGQFADISVMGWLK